MIQESGINLVDHLEELRRRLIISAAAIAAASIFSFFSSDFLIQIMTSPIKQSVQSLYFLSPYEAFLVRLKISFVSGIVLSSPVLFAQLWRFVSPGLYASERQILLPLILISTCLFLVGISFAYFLVVPFALKFFLGFQTFTLIPLISIGSYISFFLSLILVFGVVFDLPVILVGLISLKVVGTSFLSAQRNVIVILVFLLAAILTPTVDVFTQVFLALPLWLLFEISLWIGKGIEARRKPVDSQAGSI